MARRAAVVVDAIDADAEAFYRHFGFKQLEQHRLWRRVSDIDRALGGCGPSCHGSAVSWTAMQARSASSSPSAAMRRLPSRPSKRRARAAVIDSYERYWELQTTAAALRGAIEHHRRQHQGPLLQRAGGLFAKLSGGRMTGLTAVTAERQSYIMGVLPGEREVPVEDMSQGQRHQPFLALRLAALERQFEHNQPMPLILDDLLVQLDDVSARAALEILAESRARDAGRLLHPPRPPRPDGQKVSASRSACRAAKSARRRALRVA